MSTSFSRSLTITRPPSTTTEKYYILDNVNSDHLNKLTKYDSSIWQIVDGVCFVSLSTVEYTQQLNGFDRSHSFV